MNYKIGFILSLAKVIHIGKCPKAKSYFCPYFCRNCDFVICNRSIWRFDLVAECTLWYIVWNLSFGQVYTHCYFSHHYSSPVYNLFDLISTRGSIWLQNKRIICCLWLPFDFNTYTYQHRKATLSHHKKDNLYLSYYGSCFRSKCYYLR